MEKMTARQNGPATLLIVDDTPENLTVLGALLQPPYRVRAANSGERALRVAQSEPRPDLILLDVMMPGMDGYEVLRQLRADPATADIPVIFITALSDEQDELKGFELGAADYIHKPIKGAIVLSRVKAQLEAKTARDMLRKNNARLAFQVESGMNALEQAQLQLLQSEKMAAIGQLAAGVAHEINNPVGFVSSNLRTLETYLHDVATLLTAYHEAAGSGDVAAMQAADALYQQFDIDFLKGDLQAIIDESREGIGRVRQIVMDLKDFSRVGSLDWQWTDIHQGIDSTLNILRNELKYHCTVIKQYAALPNVRCLPAQLNQVFMNLLANAAQAIETRGEITITTAAQGDNAITISIADTGSGIPPDALARIFEPFYTTKPVGKGTGLGLSLVWEIVERHHGKIEVDSEVGKGTMFTVTLPVDGNPGT